MFAKYLFTFSQIFYVTFQRIFQEKNLVKAAKNNTVFWYFFDKHQKCVKDAYLNYVFATIFVSQKFSTIFAH